MLQGERRPPVASSRETICSDQATKAKTGLTVQAS
jgi:hypothetical protein